MLIKAFSGALGGTFADQWKDYIVPSIEMSNHIVSAPGVSVKQNNGRGSNTKSSANIISNGSMIFVPENTAALLVDGGSVYGVVTEPGGYEYNSGDPNAKSIFAGDGIINSLIKQSWERFKFGGQPGSNLFVIYINMKEIAGLNYGTANPIRYKDANYNNTMLAVTSFGNFSVRIVDPTAFYKNILPINAAMGQDVFDLDNPDTSDFLFSGFIGSLGEALSAYTKGGKSIDDIQGGVVDFAQKVDESVETAYQWKSNYGLEIAAVQPRGLDWDNDSVELINKFNLGSMMQGNVGNAYAQATVAEGIKAGGENGGVGGVLGGMFAGGMFGGVVQQQTQQTTETVDYTEKLTKLKNLFEQGLIDEQEYTTKKNEIISKI